MVHGMHFRALQHIAKPARRAHVGMGEQVEGRRQSQGHGRRRRAGTQHPVAGDHAQQHGSAGVQRVGVERSQHLDAPRTVMQLVEHAPQQVRGMGGAMPPVKDKAGDEKTQQPRQQRVPACPHIEKRMLANALLQQPAQNQRADQRQRAQGAAVDQPAPVAEIARGGRNHLAREDCHEQQRNQRIDQVLQHGNHSP